MNAAPKSNEEFLGHVRWMQEYLSNLPPPEYPFPVAATLAAAGKPVFAEHCASCHASDKPGKRMPMAGSDTDRESSGERRVGTEFVSTYITRTTPNHKNKTQNSR